VNRQPIENPAYHRRRQKEAVEQQREASRSKRSVIQKINSNSSIESRKERRQRMREIARELRKAGKRMARKKIREVEGD